MVGLKVIGFIISVKCGVIVGYQGYRMSDTGLLGLLGLFLLPIQSLFERESHGGS